MHFDDTGIYERNEPGNAVDPEPRSCTALALLNREAVHGRRRWRNDTGMEEHPPLIMADERKRPSRQIFERLGADFFPIAAQEVVVRNWRVRQQALHISAEALWLFVFSDDGRVDVLPQSQELCMADMLGGGPR